MEDGSYSLVRQDGTSVSVHDKVFIWTTLLVDQPEKTSVPHKPTYQEIIERSKLESKGRVTEDTPLMKGFDDYEDLDAIRPINTTKTVHCLDRCCPIAKTHDEDRCCHICDCLRRRINIVKEVFTGSDDDDDDFDEDDDQREFEFACWTQEI